MGYSEGFGNCYIPRNYIAFPCKYFSDKYGNCPSLKQHCDLPNVKGNI